MIKRKGTNITTFGDVLKELRLQCGLSQSELAVLVNMDRSYISMLERGKRRPSLDMIVRIAQGLNLESGVLLNKMVEKFQAPEKDAPEGKSEPQNETHSPQANSPKSPDK